MERRTTPALNVNRNSSQIQKLCFASIASYSCTAQSNLSVSGLINVLKEVSFLIQILLSLNAL